MRVDINFSFSHPKEGEILQRLEALEKQMSETVSRAQLDAAIKDLPDATAKAVEAAVMPLIQPAIEKMQASPEDFSTELTGLQGVGPAVGQAVAASIAKAFTPVPADTAASKQGSSATDGNATDGSASTGN